MPPLNDTKVRCVNDRLSGRLLAPGEGDWDALRGAFNLLVDQRPAAIAVPGDAHDVTMIVRLAAEHGLRVAPQGTAHNAAPLGDLGGTILLRTNALTGVEIDAERRSARVGAGARWQDVVPRASELGLAALHGSSPGVSVVGYSLGGGIGWYPRKYGLQSDSVRAVDVVTPDGRQLRASEESEPDLFWALRGGGGNFGVVTAIEFDLYEVPEVYAGSLFFPFERSAEVLHTWNRWQAGTPEEVTSIGRLLQFPPLEMVPEPLRGNSFVIVQAAIIGGEAGGAELIAPLRELVATMDTFAPAPLETMAMLHMDPLDPVPGVSGHLLVGELPDAAIERFVAAAGPGSGSQLVSVELRQTGGALSRAEPSGGALASVPGAFSMFAVGSPASEEAADSMRETIAAVLDALAPHDAGRLSNFVEQRHDAAGFFPADAFARLRDVRAAYDPAGVMHANHPVPVA